MNEEAVKWSGCNYWVNQGTNEHEPLGTAQSMHDCTGCNEVSNCTIQQETETWEWNKDIEKDLVAKINIMRGF